MKCKQLHSIAVKSTNKVIENISIVIGHFKDAFHESNLVQISIQNHPIIESD